MDDKKGIFFVEFSNGQVLVQADLWVVWALICGVVLLIDRPEIITLLRHILDVIG